MARRRQGETVTCCECETPNRLCDVMTRREARAWRRGEGECIVWECEYCYTAHVGTIRHEDYTDPDDSDVSDLLAPNGNYDEVIADFIRYHEHG